eukprot:m.152243 g.152243  ORF g.152243 m.152243 type:complete len:1731 (-) comp30797_c0_seq1:210-5402(-)
MAKLPVLMVLFSYIFPVAHTHTWMFTKGRAWMQASLDKPFRQFEGIHAQIGPQQTMVLRWASSHNNTFSLAIVAAKDEEWFQHKDFYQMLDDYIDLAPPGANEAVQKPRYHGAAQNCAYLNTATNTACAGGYCVKDLFTRKLPTSDPAYFNHKLDMGVFDAKWTHQMYEYNPDIVHNEAAGTWEKYPDRRVAYESTTYPWIVAAYRFHNKVNMHSDWDLVHLDFPARVFTDEHIALKGQHYIIQFSSRSFTDNTYTDALDVNVLQQRVDPPELVYGKSSGKWGWTKTDHCQFTEPREIVAPIRDATTNVSECLVDMSGPRIAEQAGTLFGINVLPAVNPDVVPRLITRDQEDVNPVCQAACSTRVDESQTAGFCRLETADASVAVCTSPARIHNVVWANPAVSNVAYDSSTVAGAKPGDYVAFNWDDVVHDVWLVPSDTTDPCNFTGTQFKDKAVLLIPPSHHATIDQNTEDTVRPDRNRYKIPSEAAGTTLLFVCSVNGHCNSGQQLAVVVGNQPAAPDPTLDEGVCPDGYTLCEDQAKQTKTQSTVKTNVNIPLLNIIGAESIQLSGKETRASTPWEKWAYRNITGKTCRWRSQNTQSSSKYPANAGIDWGNKPVWEFPDNTLRDVVEACSSSHPETCVGISWKSSGGDADMFSGKHTFRRCLETDQYTRLVSVGQLTEDEGRNFTTPSEFSKAVACEGCYQCREVPLRPRYGRGDVLKSGYDFYKQWRSAGFTHVVSDPGTSSAVLTINLLEPVKWFDPRLTWEYHNPEFICRINPDAVALEPELEDDAEWTTFLLPASVDSSDAVINAIASGFQPPEAINDYYSLDRHNLDVVYPPGDQIDPTVTQGPYFSQDWLNYTNPHHHYQLPTQTLSAERGGFWPPKPVVKVSFMPVVTPGQWSTRFYPHGYDSTSAAKLIEDAKGLGWFVDQGASETEHTDALTGENVTFGWRCQPVMAWYNANWREHQLYEGGTWGRYEILPAYAYGAARDIGTHFSEETQTTMERCPDGRLNAWEAEVPNGVYVVTVNYGSTGCTFENVRGREDIGTGAMQSNKDTHVFSVEVADGRFTLSSGPPVPCQAVNWLKLDLVSTDVYPDTWLPAPSKEWWQLELDEPKTTEETPGVGLVQIRLPHEAYRTSSHYPQFQEWGFADCRQWWLYSPAKCYRQFMKAKKQGVHPELVTYPNFPGFSKPFLNWLFDQHDSNGDDELFYEEFRSSQAQQSLNGTFSMWSRPGAHNVKGTKNYHDDNAAHLWGKLDSFNVGYADKGATNLGRGDGKVTRSEFTNGILSMPLTTFCDYFENTGTTHGVNIYEGVGSCQKTVNGAIPEHFGYFPEDGDHGFVVTVSDIPCDDAQGCPVGADTTVCEMRLHRTSSASAEVDCGGATGKYIQISLPGNGTRVLPQAVITAHRSSVPLQLEKTNTTMKEAIASTNPALKTVCYGVVPRPVPAANDPDLLAGAKLHPKTIVNDNPEDPIFWSTCYDRVIIKEWLPLQSSNVSVGGEATDMGLVYSFNNGSQCLACDSLRQNHVNEYDMATMPTPRWWLQPKGECMDCNHELFPEHFSSLTTTTTTMTTTTVTMTTTTTSTTMTSATTVSTTSTDTIVSTTTTPIVPITTTTATAATATTMTTAVLLTGAAASSTAIGAGAIAGAVVGSVVVIAVIVVVVVLVQSRGKLSTPSIDSSKYTRHTPTIANPAYDVPLVSGQQANTGLQTNTPPAWVVQKFGNEVLAC